MNTPLRWIVSALLLVFAGCGNPSLEDSAPRLVAEATQMGPVAYRDPAGAVSPDGRWLAYSEGRQIIVQPLLGGGRQVLGPAPSQVRYLTWLSDSQQLAVRERSFGHGTQTWQIYDIANGQHRELWGNGVPGAKGAPSTAELFELRWNRDGSRIAGVRRGNGLNELWDLASDGREARLVTRGADLSFPVWTEDGRIACLHGGGAKGQTLHLPADSQAPLLEGREVYGHVAFTRGDASVIFATPNGDGILELREARLDHRVSARRLARFARDAYEPFVLPDGRIVFKTQDYRTFIASSPAGGGETRALTTFQSETPTWSPDAKHLAVTFGGWRIASDDIAYPDIDQDLGLIDYRPGNLVERPTRIVRQSPSEDQGLSWSPNGKWMVYHSHINGTDDIYLMPADGSAEPRMISEQGYETGWPRWSPDGHWILFPSFEQDDKGVRRGVLYTIAVDQVSGATQPQSVIRLDGFAGDELQAEWTSPGEGIVFEATEGAGAKALYIVPRSGGQPELLYRWQSEQVYSGISVSPDFNWVAYIAPGADRRFQVFRIPLGGNSAGDHAGQQLTRDPTNKTQPAFSPSGDRLAFTVYWYQAQFWILDH